MKEKKTETKMKEKKIAVAQQTKECKDINCNIHGSLKVRGKAFEGIVIKKFHKRVVIEFEREIYIRKYERYTKSRTRIHARLPECLENEIKIGDYIRVQECRPLSKIVHFIVIEKIKDADKKSKNIEENKIENKGEKK